MATTTSTNEIARLRACLANVASCLDMLDPDHENHNDSCADFVEAVSQYETEIRTLANRPTVADALIGSRVCNVLEEKINDDFDAPAGTVWTVRKRSDDAAGFVCVTDAGVAHVFTTEELTDPGMFETAPAPLVYRWRLTPAGAWLYLNAEGATVGQAYANPSGVWSADPWGRARENYPTAAEAKTHIERAFA